MIECSRCKSKDVEELANILSDSGGREFEPVTLYQCNDCHKVFRLR